MPARIRTRTTLSAKRVIVVLLLLLFLPAAAVAAQQATVSTDTAGRQESFSERIDVRLITLPVLVRDRQGRAITDLRAEEIQAVDGRQRYPAAFITPFFEDAEERKDLPRVRLITQMPGRNPEVSSSTPREPRRLLLLVDLANDPPAGRADAIESLSRFVEQELDPSFQVAIMALDSGLDLLQPFTNDRAAIGTALRRLVEKRGMARVIPEVRMELLIQKLEYCRIEEPDSGFDEERQTEQFRSRVVVDPTCLRDSTYEYVGEMLPQATTFLRAIDGAVRYAAGLDGHTFVLTVGGNVGLNPAREVAEAMRGIYGPLDEINQLEQQLQGDDLMRPHLERLMMLAYQENVSLSFLDRSPAPGDFSARQQRLLQPGFRPLMTAFQSAQQDLDEIASATGGAFVASPRVSDGMRESMRLVEGGYYVSFYLKDKEPMTQRRIERMRLQTTRPGVILKHRRAFEGVRKEEQANRRRVRGIIQVGFPEEREIDGETGNIIPLRLVLDPRDLGYEETPSQATAEFTVHLRLVTPKGMLLADSYQVLRHSYTHDDWKSGKVEPPDLVAWADLPDGDYFAEAVVTVPSLGHRGTIRRHLAVRGASRSSEQKSADARSR